MTDTHTAGGHGSETCSEFTYNKNSVFEKEYFVYFKVISLHSQI